MSEDARPTLVLTRSAEDCVRVKPDYEAVGFDVLSMPLLSIVPVTFDAPDLSLYEGLVFTSRYGVHEFMANAPEFDFYMPVITVGAQTAQSARTYGFSNIVHIAQNSEALISHTQNQNYKNFLYVRARNVRRDLLNNTQFVSGELIVYDVKATHTFSENFIADLKNKNIDVIAFYSPRTVDIFCILLKYYGLEDTVSNIKALCISESVIKCITHLPWARTRVCRTPTHDEMLHEAARLI